MDTPEGKLLRRARKFEEQALAEIYDRYSPGIYRYALRLLGDPAAAEDCVAETFNRFLLALRAEKGPHDHLQAYLYRIAHNWISDSYRRQPPPPLELDEELSASASPAPERQAELNIEQERLRAALHYLTAEQRQVVTLRFVETWSLEETAEALQKPVGAIKALQHRALAALHRLLAPEKDEYHETYR